MIPYGRQEITKEDIDTVVKVLQSDFLTQGPQVPVFERVVSDYCNVTYAVAVNSGTSALHIACLALGVGASDFVWTTPITFVASANCALYCGAEADFVDIDPLTCNMSIDVLEKKLWQAKKEGRLPKVVIPVHLCGQSCQMEEIHSLAIQYGFFVIEDACHALGGKYKNEQIGNCRYSDITVFSFHPVKIITTAEGGMAVTNQQSLADRMQILRSHGITRETSKMTQKADGPWYYQQIDLGFNYRMNDIQAALGTSQFTRLEDMVSRRHCLAARYRELLYDLPLKLLHQIKESRSAWHLFVVRIDSSRSNVSHHELFDQLKKDGIGVNLHYIPIHTQPYYLEQGFCPGDFPEAERYYQEAITLPLYHHLSFEDQDIVVNSLRNILQ